MDAFEPKLEYTRKAPFIESGGSVEAFLDFAHLLSYKGRPETYGATPTDLQAALPSQLKLIHAFAQRLKVFQGQQPTSEAIDKYLEKKSLERFVDRCIANDENYRRSLSPSPFDESQERNISPIQQSVEQRADAGLASPAELIALQAINKVGSIELASLTHNYGLGLEYQEEMQDSVKEAVRFMGGIVYEDPEEVFSIDDVVNDESAYSEEMAEQYKYLTWAEKLAQREVYGPAEGMLLTRKRTIGQLPDGTLVRERTSFILNAESSLLNEAVYEQLITTTAGDHVGREAIHSIEGANDLLKFYLDTNDFSKIILVSSTIYSFNRKRVKEINEKLMRNNDLPLNGHAIHDGLRYLAASQLMEAGMRGLQSKEPKADPYYTNVNGLAYFGKDYSNDTGPILTDE